MSLAALPTLQIPTGFRRTAYGSWLAALTFVVFFSLHPKYGPPGDFELDKLAHTFGYAVLAGLPFLAFHTRRAVFWAALLMLPLGLALEGLQSFVPGRFSDPVDAVANTAGVAAGILCGPWGRRSVNALYARYARAARS